MTSKARSAFLEKLVTALQLLISDKKICSFIGLVRLAEKADFS